MHEEDNLGDLNCYACMGSMINCIKVIDFHFQGHSDRMILSYLTSYLEFIGVDQYSQLNSLYQHYFVEKKIFPNPAAVPLHTYIQIFSATYHAELNAQTH